MATESEHSASAPNAEDSAEGAEKTAEPAPPTKWQIRRARLEAADGWMKISRSFLTNMILLGLLCSLLCLMGRVALRQASNNSIEIAPIGAPDDLVKAGYTPDVLRRRLLDAAAKITSGAHTDKRSRGLIPEWPVPDIQVPGAALSVRSLAQAIFPSENQVDGEITMEPKGRVRLQLRYKGQALKETSSVDQDAISDLFMEGAEILMAEVDPYVLAAYHFRRRDDKNALAYVSQCLRNARSEDDPWAWSLWGRILTRSGQYQEAVDKFEAAEKPDDNFAPAHQAWASVLQRQRDYKKAMEHLEKAIVLAPDDSRLIATRGDLLLVQHQPERAREDYEHALRLGFSNADGRSSCWAGLGNTFLDEGRPDDAARKYEVAARLAPGSPTPFVGRGKAALAKHQVAAAIDYFKRAIELAAKGAAGDPDRAEAKVALGRALLEKGQLGDAEAQLEEAVKLEPHVQGVDVVIADTLRAKGDPVGAMAKYEEAVKHDPNCVDAWNGLSEALRAIGRVADADEKKRHVDSRLLGRACY